MLTLISPGKAKGPLSLGAILLERLYVKNVPVPFKLSYTSCEGHEGLQGLPVEVDFLGF
jgi:hypothetical protein